MASKSYTSDLLIKEQYRSYIATIPPLSLGVFVSNFIQTFVVGDFANQQMNAWQAMMVGAVALLFWRWWRKQKLNDISARQAQFRMHISMLICIVTATAGIAGDVIVVCRLPKSLSIYLGFMDFGLGLCCFIALMHKKIYALQIVAVMTLPAIWMIYRVGTPEAYGMVLQMIVVATIMIALMFKYDNDFQNLVRSKGDVERLVLETQRLANTDMLTGLPNRRYFFDRASSLEAHSRATKKKFAIGMVDLDGFKPVNDTYGHAVGDNVLKQVALRFREALPHGVELFRIGGDEFALLLDDEAAAANLSELGRVLIGTLALPLQIVDLKISVGCSIGFAILSEMANTAEAVIEQADFALYYVKRSGRGTAAVFSDEHKLRIAADGAVEQALRQADFAQEIYPVFQPIVDTGSGRTRAFECLARWNNPTLGQVSPAMFIPIAERIGLISKITLFVLRKAIEQMKSWPEEIGLSFNLSAYDLTDTAGITNILAILNNNNIPGRRVTFEITETALMQDFALVQANVDMMRRYGAGIALDDFGTGYSSLTHVSNLPLSKIKIDRQFVSDIESNAVSQSIVRTILALCRDMKLECIIEGVELEGQAAFIREMGGDFIQGYFYSRPLAADAVRAFLIQRHGQAPTADCA